MEGLFAKLHCLYLVDPFSGEKCGIFFHFTVKKSHYFLC